MLSCLAPFSLQQAALSQTRVKLVWGWVDCECHIVVLFVRYGQGVSQLQVPGIFCVCSVCCDVPLPTCLALTPALLLEASVVSDETADLSHAWKIHSLMSERLAY